MKKVLIILLLMAHTLSNAQELDRVAYKDCGENKQAALLGQMIIESKDQQRNNLICNKTLSQIAFKKAKKMAEIQKVVHNIDNTTPNELLRKGGINLPQIYSYLGNQVESVSGGMDSPKETYHYFLSSKDHKSHLLGENTFFQEQNQIGVGYYTDVKTDHVTYWVVYITALKEQKETTVLYPIIAIEKQTEAEKRRSRKRYKRGDHLNWQTYKK